MLICALSLTSQDEKYYWPEIAIEIGHADPSVNSRRDIALWLDGSNGEVSLSPKSS
jgi:hypothetical protein